MLEATRLTGLSLTWIIAHRNALFVNGFLSESQPLTCGLPQGTILGPLLFILHINDLPNCLVNSHPRMYADDTHLIFASNDVVHLEENMNDDLTRLTEWLTANNLTLSKSKTSLC